MRTCGKHRSRRAFDEVRSPVTITTAHLRALRLRVDVAKLRAPGARQIRVHGRLRYRAKFWIYAGAAERLEHLLGHRVDVEGLDEPAASSAAPP